MEGGGGWPRMMDMAIVDVLILLVVLYLGVGLGFAVGWTAYGHAAVDPAAQGAILGPTPRAVSAGVGGLAEAVVAVGGRDVSPLKGRGSCFHIVTNSPG